MLFVEVTSTVDKTAVTPVPVEDILASWLSFNSITCSLKISLSF